MQITKGGGFYSNKSSIAFQLLARKVIVKMKRAIICFYIYLQWESMGNLSLERIPLLHISPFHSSSQLYCFTLLHNTKKLPSFQQLTTHPFLTAILLLLPSPICGSAQVRSHSLELCPRSNYNNVLSLWQGVRIHFWTIWPSDQI